MATGTTTVKEPRQLLKWSSKMKDLYDNQVAVTHILRVNGEEYSCNSAVLHAALPDIPAEEWEETFSKVSPPLVIPLLRYMYCSEIAVTMETLKDIMLASKILQLTHLTDACAEFLKEELSPSIVLGWYSFSMKEGFEALAEHCKAKFHKEIDDVRQCQEFAELSFGNVSDVIRDQMKSYGAVRMDVAFYAVMSWLVVDADRHKHAETLLDMLELSKCSRKCLQTATEEPYSRVLWSVSLQNKLLHASFQSTDNLPSSQVRSQLVKQHLIKKKKKLVKQQQPMLQPVGFGVRKHLGSESDRSESDRSESDEEKELPDQPGVLGVRKQANADFATSIQETFMEFYQNNLYTDIRIKGCAMNITAHQIMLAVVSPYFDTFIRRSGENDKKSTQVDLASTLNEAALTSDLSHLDPKALRSVVDFAYTRSAEITDTTLMKLIETCDFLQLDEMMKLCRMYSKDAPAVTQDNYMEWIKAGSQFSLPRIQARAIAFVCRNFDLVKDNLLELDEDTMMMVLNSEDLPVQPERSLYECIIEWMMHQAESRRPCLPGLLDTKAPMKCKEDTGLDMKALLDGSDFDVDEREQVWATHYKRLRQKLQKLLAPAASAVAPPASAFGVSGLGGAGWGGRPVTASFPRATGCSFGVAASSQSRKK